MLRTQFVVTAIPQIPNIGYWRRSGGDTSERGADSAIAEHEDDRRTTVASRWC